MALDIAKHLEARADLDSFDVDEWERKCGPHYFCGVVRLRMRQRATLKGDKIGIVAVLRLRELGKFFHRLRGHEHWKQKNRSAAKVEAAMLAECRRLRKAALLEDKKGKEERK